MTSVYFRALGFVVLLNASVSLGIYGVLTYGHVTNALKSSLPQFAGYFSFASSGVMLVLFLCHLWKKKA